MLYEALMKIYLSFLFVVVCVFTATASLADQPVAITISVPSTTMRAGADLFLDIEITNITSENYATVVSFPPELGEHINVVYQNGNLAPRTAYGRSVYENSREVRLMADPHRIQIAPGKQFHLTATLNDLYDMTKPGVYTIQVKNRDDSVASNSITLTVQN